jgi:hypothetical protein
VGEIVANLIAGIALCFTAATWWIDRKRGKRSDRRQRELDYAQTALKQRQLLLDEQMLVFAREMRKSADIRVTLDRLTNRDSTYRLTLRNAGHGPAFGVSVDAEGPIDRSAGWDPPTDFPRIMVKVLDDPIERMDPESQPYASDFKVEYPGFSGPVTLVIRWHDSSDDAVQTKRIRLTP